MRKSKLITELTIDEFRKVASNITVLEHRKHHFDKDGNEIDSSKTGEFVTDSKGGRHWVAYEGGYCKITWDEKKLLDLVEEAIHSSEEEGFKNRCICIALHTKPSEEEIETSMKEKHVDRKTAISFLNYNYSYLDKWLTREGSQTYLIGCDIQHLYVGKRKFYARNGDYFEFKKSETETVYLVRY